MNSKYKILQGRTALITGAGAGLGKGMAEAIAAAGGNVVITVRKKEAGDAVIEKIRKKGGSGIAIVADATSMAQMKIAIDLAVKTYGGLDIAIHNANHSASAMPIAIEAVTEAYWRDLASVAHDGAFILAKLAYPHLQKSTHGCYILLVSSFGFHGAAMNPVYSTLKGGDRGFIKALAREWGPDQICVYGVAPSGATETATVFFNTYPEVRDKYLTNFPMGRIGDPREDIGEAVVNLCSERYRYVTGQTVLTDGGLYSA